jgi:hypothetical protein
MGYRGGPNLAATCGKNTTHDATGGIVLSGKLLAIRNSKQHRSFNTPGVMTGYSRPAHAF